MLTIAKKWKQGHVSAGDAIKASLEVHTVARNSSNSTTIAVARARHVVTTAHMADLAMGQAWYALKAMKHSGKPVEAERK